MVQTSLPHEGPILQDDNAPINTAKQIQEWFHGYQDESAFHGLITQHI